MKKYLDEDYRKIERPISYQLRMGLDSKAKEFGVEIDEQEINGVYYWLFPVYRLSEYHYDVLDKFLERSKDESGYWYAHDHFWFIVDAPSIRGKILWEKVKA